MIEMTLQSLWIPANQGAFPAINSKMEFSYLYLVNQEPLISSREVESETFERIFKIPFSFEINSTP